MSRRRTAMQGPQGPTAPAYQTDTIPAPVTGWNTLSSLADMPPTDAVVLDNWICRPDKILMRGGAQDWSTGYAGGQPVKSLIAYLSGVQKRMFACTDTGIFDATNQTVVGAAVSTITNGYGVGTNFATSAGQYLAFVNGTDPYRYYDGMTWTTVATFTYGAGTFNTALLVNIVPYKQRLFFAAVSDLNFYYLDPNGTITGTIKQFPLGQLCKRGGYLAGLDTWTIDGGSGVDELIVFVTSEGEAIVYSGTDPSNVASWKLVGIWYIGRPIGRKCTMKFGGDLLILTERGLFPLSKALQTASLDRTAAITNKIDPTFAQSAQSFSFVPGWEMTVHTTQSFLIVNIPGTPKVQYVMQLQTGGWSRFTGWDASCILFYDGNLYYGTAGKVVQAAVGFNDFGGNILATAQGAYNYYDMRGKIKHVKLLRPNFQSTGPFQYSIGALADFQLLDPTSLVGIAAQGTSKWDVAQWDQAKWGSDLYTQNFWSSIAVRPAQSLSIYLQVQSNNVQIAHVATDTAFIPGGLI